MLTRNLGRQCVKFKSHDTIEIINPLNELKTFSLDRVFDIESTQKEIFDSTAKPLIADVLQGYNATIFTYGQSGSGKTYTMYGEDLLDEECQGIIPRAISEIFSFINDEKNNEIKFELKFSMLEIYMENLYDLLNPDARSNELKIKEHTKRGIYVENLSEIYITSQEEFLLLIHEAEQCRSVSETSLNKNSSRSHLLFQLQITQKLPDETERRGALNLIDLAGSEKVSKTHAMGITLEEARKINLSLSNLGNVIYALASNSDYIPYRDSKLTRIIQDSLGGNSKTMLIVACSVHSYNAEETLSTLQFAKRAKKIKNKVRKNIKRSTEQLEEIIEFLTEKLHKAHEEIEKLKAIMRNSSDLAMFAGNLEFLRVENNKNSENSKHENNNDIGIYNSIEDCIEINDEFYSGNDKNNFEILSKLKRKGSSHVFQNAINDFVMGNDFRSKIIEINSSEKSEKKMNSFNRQNFNFSSENFNYESNYEKEKLEFENTINHKNKEIEELKSEIGNFNYQNCELKEKVEQMIKDNIIEKLIQQTEKSMKEFIKELTYSNNKIKVNELKQLQDYLHEMKSYQIKNENKYLEIIKDITEFKEADFNEKLNYLNSKISNYSNSQNDNIGSNRLINMNVTKKHNVNNFSSNNGKIDNNINLIGKNPLLNINGVNEMNFNSNEKEVALFDHLDDDLDISIMNSSNRIGLKNPSSSRNTLRFTVKRHVEEKNLNTNNGNNTLLNDSISNISTNNKNLIHFPRDRDISKSRINMTNRDQIPNSKVNLLKESNKSKSQNLINTNLVKRSNTLNFDFTESSNLFMTGKNVENKNNTIKIIENFENLSPKRIICFNKNDHNNLSNTPNKLFNTLTQFNSNEEKIDKLLIKNDRNSNGYCVDKRRNILKTNNEFNFSCEDLFKKIEKKFNKKSINTLQFIENSEKKDYFNINNNKNDDKCEKNLIDKTKINEKSNESRTKYIDKSTNLRKCGLNTDSNFNSMENGNFDFKNKTGFFYNQLILSYKKIFENNSFYSKRILDEFLRNLDLEVIGQNKLEKNKENSVLHNIKNNFIDENKSTIRTNDKKSEFNFGNNMNLLNNTTIQDDLFSVNDKMDRKDHIRILNCLENHPSKKDLDFTLNKNNNVPLDNITCEDRNFGCDSRMVVKLKNGFVSLMLKNIYYEKITLELLTRLSLDLSKNKDILYKLIKFTSFLI